MPADANAAGDIFGGWVMAQMDLACGIRAAERAKGRVVTAAVKEMSFAKPMKIGDTLCVYTEVTRVGRTSMTLKVEAWAQRYLSDLMEKVTDADFVMVALDGEGQAEAGAGRNRSGIRGGLGRPTGDFDHRRTGLLRRPASRGTIEQRLRPGDAFAIAARPFGQRGDRLQQLAAEIGQFVFDARRDGREIARARRSRRARARAASSSASSARCRRRPSRNSLKRSGPSPSLPTTSTVHLSPTRCRISLTARQSSLR